MKLVHFVGAFVLLIAVSSADRLRSRALDKLASAPIPPPQNRPATPSTPGVYDVKFKRDSYESLKNEISSEPVPVLDATGFISTSQVDLTTCGVACWPELGEGVSNKVGIAFSGGGSRSYSASVGYLSYMHSQNWLDSLSHVAGASGGSWVATNFVLSQDAAVSDDEFLGPIRNPKTLSMANIQQMNRNSLAAGTTATIALDVIAAMAAASVGLGPYETVWHTGIAKSVLGWFGLDDMKTPFSLNSATAAKIKAANPSIKNVYIPTKPRPFLVVLGTIVTSEQALPRSTPSGETFTVYPNEFTQLSSGYPLLYSNEEFKGVNGETIHGTWGGAVETFAAGGVPPNEIVFVGDKPTTTLYMTPNATQYSVVSPGIASGTSSHAGGWYGQTTQSPLSGVDPEANDDTAAIWKALGLNDEALFGPGYHLFPLNSHAGVTKDRYTMADGAFVAHTPAHSLVARGIKKIAYVLNTQTPISDDYQASQGYVQGKVPSDICALFGIDIPSTWMNGPTGNQMFARSDYEKVMSVVLANRKAGKGGFARFTLTTVANTKFGFPAGLSIDVAFFVLTSSDSFVSALASDTQTELRRSLAGGIGCYNPFNPCKFMNFPHFKTAGQNYLHPFSYTNAQVNLLSALTQYTMAQNANELKDFFTS